jgi:hypothetical protein
MIDFKNITTGPVVLHFCQNIEFGMTQQANIQPYGWNTMRKGGAQESGARMNQKEDIGSLEQ